MHVFKGKPVTDENMEEPRFRMELLEAIYESIHGENRIVPLDTVAHSLQYAPIRDGLLYLLKDDGDKRNDFLDWCTEHEDSVHEDSLANLYELKGVLLFLDGRYVRSKTNFDTCKDYDDNDKCTLSKLIIRSVSIFGSNAEAQKEFRASLAKIDMATIMMV